MSQQATYDFTQADRVICIGDLEGQYPFFETTDIARNEKLPKNRNGSRNGKMLFTIDTESRKPIVINADPHTALVTCGDLIDHGVHDIRLLQACTMSENPNIIWTIGNRDINKIRLIDEFFICNKVYAITLPWKDGNFNSLGQVIKHVYDNIENYTFRFEYDAIKRRFQNWKAPTQDVLKDIYTRKTSMAEYVKKRVHDIYSKTLGVTEITAKVYHHYDELVLIGLLSPPQNITDEELQLFKCICICVTIMIMCIEWNKENGINAPWFKALNGLHTKYIQKAHIMSTFKFNNQTAVVSHSGLPEIVSDSLGYGDCDGISSSEIALIVNNIDVEKSDFIHGFNEYWNKIINQPVKTHQNYILVTKVYNVFNKYIELSNYNGVTLPNKEYSPITNAISFKGGEWYDTKQRNKYYYRKAENKSGLTYNIFGHQPQGVMPNIKQQENGLYDIGLDISVVGQYKMKGHEVAYLGSGSFACLEFNRNEQEPHFKGCVMHTSSFDLDTKKGTTVEEPEFIVAYDKTLGEFKAFRDQYRFDSGPNHACLTPPQHGGKRKPVRKAKLATKRPSKNTTTLY